VFACVSALAIGCGGKADGKATKPSGPIDEEHCSNLGDQGGASVSVVLENQTAKPLYIGPETASCDPTFNSDYSVRTDTGASVSATRACGNVACSDLGSGHFQGFACPNLCLNDATYSELMPGETRRSTWFAAGLAAYELPSKCLGESPYLLSSCTRVEPLPAGTELYFEAWAGDSVVCTSTSACAACTRGPSGDCTLQAHELGETKLSATANLLLDESFLSGDADAAVTLVFKE
jgi:hypothetical protein